MCRAVLADEAAPVERKHDRQLLEADVFNNLIVRPLQECRVYGDDGFQALERQAGSERHTMLLGNPYIVEPVGKDLRELLEAGPRHMAAVTATIFSSV